MNYPLDVAQMSVKFSLAEMYRIIGTDIVQAITPHYTSPHRWFAYCDEEGKMKGRPVNSFANALAWSMGWPPGDVLVGNVVFVGPIEDEETEEHTDVPQDLLDQVERMMKHWPKWTVGV